MKKENIDSIILDIGAKPRSKKRQVNPDGYKVVSVRLREAEFMSFAEQAQAYGMTNNMALRVAARRIAGFLEIDAVTREVLQQISLNIGLISDNMNDMRSTCSRTGTVDMAKFEKMRLAFGQEFMQLDSLLRTLLNVTRRRIDGRAMLEAQVHQ